jgi:hypothetical protein
MKIHGNIAVLVCLVFAAAAHGQYSTVTTNTWVYEGYVYFQVISDNTGSQILFNETCILNSKDPGGTTQWSGQEGINLCYVVQSFPYEANREAGVFETKITAYDVPNEGTPPFTPVYYLNDSLLQNTSVSPWLKIVPGGWTVTRIALKNGTSSVGAYITTSRGCTGAVTVDGAYNKPEGLQTNTLPAASVTGNASQQSNTYFSLGSLVTAENNTVGGMVRASIQLQSHPSGCTLLKDAMFESALDINTQ